MKSHGRMFPRIVYMAIASFLLSTLVACEQSESGKKSEANQSSEATEQQGGSSGPSDVAFELGVPENVQKELADAILNEDEAEKVKHSIEAKLGKIGGDSVNVLCKDNGGKKRTFGFLYLSLDEVGHHDGEGMDDGVMPEPEPTTVTNVDDDMQDEMMPVKPAKKLKPKHKKFKFGGHNGRKFIPLFCTSNLSIELKGLTKGAMYQLTAQFYSLSKKVKYEGVTTFSYPEETKIDLVMTPVKQGSVKVNVIFDDEEKDDEVTADGGEEEGEEEEGDLDAGDEEKKGSGSLVVNFKGKIGKQVGLIAMSTDSKCGINTYALENQCGAKNLWKSASFVCHDGKAHTEKSVLCRDASYFEKISETKCQNVCSAEISFKEVVSSKESKTIDLPSGPYWIIIRNNIEKDESIDKTKVFIKEGGKASVDLTL